MRIGWLSRQLAFAILASSILNGAAVATPLLDESRIGVSFGRIPPGVQILQPVFLTNVGDTPLTISGLQLSGTNASDYSVGGTCGVPSLLAAGARCRVDITASLNIVGGTSVATLTVQSDSSTAGVPMALSAIPSNDLSHGLIATPLWVDFDHQPVGVAAATQTLTLTNPEVAALALTFDGVALIGDAAADFMMISNCVVGNKYSTNASCSATIGFTPSTNGPRSAQIVFRFHPGNQAAGFATVAYSVTGIGGAVAPVSVVEYYNAVLDHYFITWVPQEISDLDNGVHKGWTRTAQSFKTYTTGQLGTSPVCRFYIPPELGDSHFFGRGTVECNSTGQKNPSFVLEDPAFMQMFLPVAGVCPANTMQVYRVFSNRPDANHRYMTDKTIEAQMVAKGWLPEGDGPDLVVMCAPQ